MPTQKSDNTHYKVFDHMIEGVQVIDRKFRYFYVNDSIAKQGKSSKRALLGKTMMEKYPGIEKSEVFKRIRQCMKSKNSNHMLNEFKFPNGSRGWFELSFQSVPEGVLILSFDITKQKEIELQLAEKLVESDHMISVITTQNKQLEDFCYIIAHNLRAPLSNLLLLNDMVKEAETLDEKTFLIDKQKPVIDHLHEMFEELVSALQVKNSVLVQKKKVEFEKTTKTVLELLQGELLSKHAEVKFDFSKINNLEYPPNYFESIIFNLVSNAIKYSSPDRKPKIQLKSYVKNGKIILEVKDNGLGIDLVVNKDKLFKLRKTFHNHPNSKGFGLFITKTQLEAMGGDIEVKSAPGKGSTFTVTLINSN